MNLPNLLTVGRIALIPVIVGLFYVPDSLARWAMLILFVAAAVTDWFDGWLARRWNQTSEFGRFLDPIADKLLVGALLVMLPAAGVIDGVHLIPAVAIMLREIAVSGLREFMAGRQVVVHVTRIAKWKTAAQLTALALLLAPLADAHTAGLALLWGAGVLTVWSGYDYFRGAWRALAD